MNLSLNLPIEIRLLNRIFYYTFIFLLIVYIVNLVLGFNNINYLTLTYLIISFALFLLSTRYPRLVKLYSWVFVILYLVGINFLWYYNCGSKGSSIYGDFIPFIIFCIIFKGWERIAVASIFIVNILSLYYLELKYPQQIASYSSETERFLDMTSAAVLVFITIMFIINYLIKNYEIEKRKAEAQKLNAENLNFELIAEREKLILKKNEIEIKNKEIELFSQQLEKEKNKVQHAYHQRNLFMACLSHELRNPLNGILGFADLLKGDPKEKEKEEYLKFIKSCGENMLFLINDILDLSKIEAKKIELHYSHFYVKSVIMNVINILKIKSDMKRIEFISEIDIDDTYELYLDELRLRQILFNFLDNAIKFTFSGYVKLNLKTKNINTESNRLDLIIDIIDTGEGIPEDEHEKIFEPYIQRKGQNTSKYKGTGLGLSISKELVEMMGGNISLLSKPKAGTTFTLYFQNISFRC